jgi:hypothetical protein
LVEVAWEAFPKAEEYVPDAVLLVPKADVPPTPEAVLLYPKATEFAPEAVLKYPEAEVLNPEAVL